MRSVFSRCFPFFRLFAYLGAPIAQLPATQVSSADKVNGGATTISGGAAAAPTSTADPAEARQVCEEAAAGGSGSGSGSGVGKATVSDRSKSPVQLVAFGPPGVFRF